MIAPFAAWRNFPDCGTGAGSPMGLPELKRQIWESREGRTVKTQDRVSDMRELHREELISTIVWRNYPQMEKDH